MPTKTFTNRANQLRHELRIQNLLVFCLVALDEGLAGVEEDAPLALAAGHPDGEHGGFEAGAQLEGCSLLEPMSRYSYMHVLDA
jgi:hypothetical protein